MSTKLNPRKSSNSIKLAGGAGSVAAIQSHEADLRRLVLANMLFEKIAYVDGREVATQIKELIPKVAPDKVAAIAVAAREEQKLRHVPLLLIREMARHEGYKGYVSKLIPRICTRADMLTDLLGLYWEEGRTPLSKQMKLGLGNALKNFNEYALAKYNRKNTAVSLRDVLFLCRPRPRDSEQEALWNRLANDTLATPDTWEVALSSGCGKKETWERLIQERKIGSLAFLRNLANMVKAECDSNVIAQGFATVNTQMLLPLNFLIAAEMAPTWRDEIEALMLRTYSQVKKLPGRSILVIDVSGSMTSSISSKSKVSRLDAACAMAILAAATCEQVTIYATAGSDPRCRHQTRVIPSYEGFSLKAEIKRDRLGGGGIFTRQALDYIQKEEMETPDRIMVFSDSQDCDPEREKPKPFGTYNYIIDVSAHRYGINYAGVWTAEMSGFSEQFLNFVRAYEGLDVVHEDELSTAS